MGQEMLFLQQYFAVPWAAIALLVCLFLTLVLRPERILHRGMFQAACWLLALSIIVPAALNALVMLVSLTAQNLRPGRTEWMWLVSLVHSSGPVLIGLGVLFGLLALVPRWTSGTPQQPTRHPLE